MSTPQRKDAIAGVMNLLADNDAGVRAAAVSALTKLVPIGGEEVIAALCIALADEDSMVRCSAAEALGRVGGEAANIALHGALAAQDWAFFSSVVKALEQINSRQSLPSLVQCLERTKEVYLLIHKAITTIQENCQDYSNFSQPVLEKISVEDMSMEQKLVLKIVVASPGDVQPERNKLSNVVEELNHSIASAVGLRLELLRWETDAHPGFHTEGPQGLIDSILRIEDCDLLIGIFWKRFGTPVKDAQSGTEHEFYCAYEAWKKQQRPQIMFYFCQRPYTPSSPVELDQWKEVLSFNSNFPSEGLWWSYKSKNQFEKLVRNHITQFILRSGSNYKNLDNSKIESISPVQRISIPLMHILHLSDLHFGTTDNARNWYSQLAEDLRYELNCPRLDAIILSGDIANKSTPEEYKAAHLFLDNLRQEFQLQPQQIVIVPGNHDLNWGLAKKAYSLERREDYQGELQEGCFIDRGDIIEVRDEAQYQQRFSHFSTFYQSIKGEPYPLEYEQQGILHHFPEQNLLILGLNSAWKLDHHYKSRASIHPAALSTALTQIRQNPAYSSCRKMVVWHHPLNSAFEDRITDHGFMEQLAKANFRFALHGHIHKAENSLYRYDLSTAGRKLDIVCAGTFGAPTRELVSAYPWQYNLLKLEGNKLTVFTRRREELNGAWKPDARWLQGAGQNPLPYYEIQLFAE